MPVILLSNYESYTDGDGVKRARRAQVESQYPWVGAQLLQGGNGGVVFKREGGTYTTSFMEAFIDGTFIRGEGATIQEAETSAWAKYELRNACAVHEWEARGYHNGAGICKNCNTFQSNVFTGDQLKQFCSECGVGTTYSWELIKGTKEYSYECELHYSGVR